MNDTPASILSHQDGSALTLHLLRGLMWSFFALYMLSEGPAVAQDQSADLGAIRGNRAEVSVTIKEGTSQLIGPLVTVKLYYQGALAGQMATTKGRAVFILNRLGDYTVTADAVGYRSAQKEISVPVAVEAEEEISLQRDSNAEALGPSSGPLLAPRAKDAFDKSLEALHDNKLDKAQKQIEEALKLAPSHPDVLYVQGVIYLRRAQWDKAEAVLEKATQIDPKHAHALSALGMAYVDAGKYEQALAPLEQSVAIDPAGWETHWALGKAYYAQGQYDRALAESQESLKQAKGEAPQAELLVAQTLTAVGRYEDSAQTLRQFLKNHPDDPGAAMAKRWLQRLAADGKIHSQ